MVVQSIEAVGKDKPFRYRLFHFVRGFAHLCTAEFHSTSDVPLRTLHRLLWVVRALADF